MSRSCRARLLHSFPTRRSSDLLGRSARERPVLVLLSRHRASGGSPAGPGRRRSKGGAPSSPGRAARSEEHTSELQSRGHLVCRLLLEKKKIGKYVKTASGIRQL